MSRFCPRDGPNTIWSVTGRVNWREFHLEMDRAYEIFLRHFRECLAKFSVELLSFVAMSNHYHFVARMPDERRFHELTSRTVASRHRRPWPRAHMKSQVIAQLAHRLKLWIAKELQCELGISGHLWGGRHHRRRIDDLWALVVVVAYQHRNPVRARMCARPEQYERSSAAWWRTGATCHLPPCGRDDFPFETTQQLFRKMLLRLQQEKRLDDVMEQFAKTRLRIDSERGRAELERLLRDAGIDPLCCGTDAADL